ncbi:MAG: hypothetical protein AAB601_02280 [Patescibacteria group bacterium]
MKRIASVCLALFVALSPVLSNEPERSTRFFIGDGGWIEYRHTVALPPYTTELFRKSLIGDFTFGGTIHFVETPDWQLTATVNIQNIFGGFVKRRAKVYAADYRITFGWYYTLENRLQLSVATVHKSTHLADAFIIESVQDAFDLTNIRLDTEDLNILRIGVGRESANDEWVIAFQPILMRFFIIAEPNLLFDRLSYIPYENRVYAIGTTTLWRNEHMRVSVTGEGEFESNFEYAAALRWSAHLGQTPARDGVQISIENSGGVGTNRIKTTSFNGLGTNRWSLSVRVTI